jgi:hypothetical protein
MDVRINVCLSPVTVPASKFIIHNTIRTSEVRAGKQHHNRSLHRP